VGVGPPQPRPPRPRPFGPGALGLMWLGLPQAEPLELQSPSSNSDCLLGKFLCVSLWPYFGILDYVG
ncbi:MAG: hypothetical protein Q6363_001975, partial [Candidatus Njordarchaeota archaeon]